MAFLIDADRARDLHRNMIRAARTRAMVRLDAAAWRLLEEGGSLAEIAAKKEALRDLPSDPAIVAATDVAMLRAVWHPELGDIANFIPPPGNDPLVAATLAPPLDEAQRAELAAFIAERDSQSG